MDREEGKGARYEISFLIENPEWCLKRMTVITSYIYIFYDEFIKFKFYLLKNNKIDLLYPKKKKKKSNFTPNTKISDPVSDYEYMLFVMICPILIS